MGSNKTSDEETAAFKSPGEIPTVEGSSDEIDEAQKRERKNLGRASNILTGGGGAGLDPDEGNLARRTLLGV